MWSKILLLLGIVELGYCQFLGLGGLGWGDFDNGLNPWLLNQPGIGIRQQHHGKCTSSVNGVNQDGNCLTRPECTFNGGRVAGRTGCSLGVCCVFSKGCSQTTNKRVSYFENTATNDIDTCQYIVRTENNNICQMRLDFESFNFPQPSRAGTQNQTGSVILSGPYLCRDAYLQVSSPNNGRIPIICGNLNGQHIYVPVNASEGQRQLVLNIVNNQNTNNGNSLNWRIKITQLECPALVKTQKNIRLWEDSRMIAPDGCLQYYTESSGRIRNLGYDESLPLSSNHYQSNLNYAICFRRIQDACGVSFNMEQFSLPQSSVGNSDDCTTADLVDTDYLFVPNGRFTGFDNMGMAPGIGTTMMPITVRNQNRYCGNWMEENSVIQETTPGPLYIFFRTDATTYDLEGTVTTPPTTISPNMVNLAENGWVLTYNILRGNSCT